jgi:hypothetical protein
MLLLFLAPALVALTLGGCKKKVDEEEEGGVMRPRSTQGGAAKLEKVKVDKYGTLKGRIVYDGTPPAPKDIRNDTGFAGNQDKSHCLADPTQDSYELAEWKVGKDNGVDGVVIWVRPPKNKEFPEPPADKKAVDQDVVVIDQPYCAFEPKISVVVPGQKMVIQNSAPMSHNTSWHGDPVKNAGGNFTLPGKKGDTISKSDELKLTPDPRTPIRLNCDIHKWMSGTVWSSDTPYAVVSHINRKDGKPDGSFELKNVPAGSEVRIVTWHEGAGFFGDGGADGKTMTLKEGENDLGDIKVKAK